MMNSFSLGRYSIILQRSAQLWGLRIHQDISALAARTASVTQTRQTTLIDTKDALC